MAHAELQALKLFVFIRALGHSFAYSLGAWVGCKGWESAAFLEM